MIAPYAHRPVKPPTKVITPLSRQVTPQQIEEIHDFAEAFSVSMIVAVGSHTVILLGSGDDVMSVISFATGHFPGVFCDDPLET